MASSLQLTPVIMTDAILSSIRRAMGRDEALNDLLHRVYMSKRTLRALFGGKAELEERSVIVADRKDGRGIRCRAFEFAANDSSQGAPFPPSYIIAPPNVIASVNSGSVNCKVHVSVADSDCPAVSQLSVVEVSAGPGHSGRVHEHLIRRLVEGGSLTVSCGEVFALPTWDADAIHEYNEVSELSAEPISWIAPGRVLDRTDAIVYYKVVNLLGQYKNELNYGTVTSSTNIFMVAPRRNVESAVPFMKAFLFPARQRRPIPEITEWLRTRKGSGLLISTPSSNAISRIADSCDSSGLFLEIINCASLRDSEEFMTLLERIQNPRAALVVLTSFHKVEDLPNLPSSLLEKHMFLAISESYESAVARVLSPFFFTNLFELQGDSGDEQLISAYATVLRGVPGINTERCGQELKQRRSALKNDNESKSPNVNWEDIGGLETAKQELRDLMGSGLRRGVLLYGPPGTGKSLLAKAIATQAAGTQGKTQFIGVKGPELLSMYIGESEKNVRAVFDRARKAEPCVVFFDEIDSLAPARGRASDSANVMDRVVSSLLTELDNLPPDVIVVAATNRPDLLDSSLLRPGRIDRQVYVGIPEDKSDIVHALIRQFQIPDVSGSLLDEIRNHIPRSMTGSDLAGVFRKAYLTATKHVTNKLAKVAAERGVSVLKLRALALASDQDNNAIGPQDFEVQISAADIIDALSATAPSVSESELKMYEELRDRRATVIG